MSGGMFTGLDNAVTNGFSVLVTEQAMKYSGMMSLLVVSSVTIFLMIRGYQTLAGKLQTPVADIVYDVGRMLLILAFVTNSGNYLNFAGGMIDDFKNGFGSDGSGGNIWVLLDTLWEKAQILGQKIYDQDTSTYVKFSGGVGQTFVWVGTMLTLGMALFVNLCAEVILYLMQATGPIFIFCLMYGFLREMFNNWLKTIFTAILTILLASLSLQIMISYFAKVMTAAASMVSEANMITLGGQCCMAAIGAAIIIYLSAKIAGALAGASVLGTVQGAAAVGLLSAGYMAKSAAPAAAKALGRADKGASAGMSYVGQKASDGISSYMNTRALRSVAVDNMRKLNK